MGLAWFVIGNFCLPQRKKYPGKIFSLTFQTNINLHMFRDEFVVKNEILMSAGILFFSQENSWDQWVDDHCFWQSKYGLIYYCYSRNSVHILKQSLMIYWLYCRHHITSSTQTVLLHDLSYLSHSKSDQYKLHDSKSWSGLGRAKDCVW